MYYEIFLRNSSTLHFKSKWVQFRMYSYYNRKSLRIICKLDFQLHILSEVNSDNCFLKYSYCNISMHKTFHMDLTWAIYWIWLSLKTLRIKRKFIIFFVSIKSCLFNWSYSKNNLLESLQICIFLLQCVRRFEFWLYFLENSLFTSVHA